MKLKSLLLRESLNAFKNARPDIFYGGIVFCVIVAVFFPLVFFGGFHHQDDFHFFRAYSPRELFQVWYSNYNFTGIESDGYRPLLIWTDHFLYAIFGFNPQPYLMLIVLLNGLYGLVAYRLARHYLERIYAVLAALLAVLLPQTLFKFTFVTATYATVFFGLMLLCYDFLLRWYKTQNKKYLTASAITAVVASLYKESAYCLLLSIPLVVIAGNWHNKKHKFRNTFLHLYVWLPLLLTAGLLIIRHYALLVFPERLNRGLPDFALGFNRTFLSQIIGLFHSLEREVVGLFHPVYETFFKGFFDQYYYSGRYCLDPFILVAIPIVGICYLVNRRIWKSRIVLIICLAESLGVIVHVWAASSPLFFAILHCLPGSRCFFDAYYFLFYVLLAVIIRELWICKDHTPIFFLFAFLVIGVIPSSIAPLNRLRIASNVLSLIFMMFIFQYIQRSVSRNKIRVKAIFVGVFSVIIFLFAARTVKFILIDNFKYSDRHLATYRHIAYVNLWRNTMREKYNLDAQVAHAKAMVEEAIVLGYEEEKWDVYSYSELYSNIPNRSFEQGLEGWEGPSDCSNTWPGVPAFTADFSDDATDGDKSLLLGSENHIAGVSTRIQNLDRNHYYRLSFDARKLTGSAEPSIYISPVIDAATRHRTFPLSNGWERHSISFAPDDNTILVVLYCKSRGEHNSLLYDNLRLNKMGEENVVALAIRNPPAFIPNRSFEQGLEGWEGPSNCSNTWPGLPAFTADFSDNATDGDKSLLLGSENHIAGVSTKIQNLDRNHYYRLSFDAKKLSGAVQPSIHVGPVDDAVTRLQVSSLSNGWKRYHLFFVPEDSYALVVFYCKSRGEKNVILYDNVRLARSGWRSLPRFLQTEYQWPSFFSYPVFEACWN